MVLTASKLRQNIYRILDQVAETGVAVEIVRGKRRLKIVPAEGDAPRKIERLKPAATRLIDHEELRVSPAVVLELEYLHETRRISVSANVVVQGLAAQLG